MSDTSIISTRSVYDDNDDDHKKNRNDHNDSSFCHRYWFSIITSFLILIILTISIILAYVLYSQTLRDRERKRIKKEFQQKHGLANKVLDMVRNDGIIAKWFKTNKGSTLSIFRELMTEMVETIFDA
jgi:hypothetical protein